MPLPHYFYPYKSKDIRRIQTKPDIHLSYISSLLEKPVFVHFLSKTECSIIIASRCINRFFRTEVFCLFSRKLFIRTCLVLHEPSSIINFYVRIKGTFLHCWLTKFRYSKIQNLSRNVSMHIRCHIRLLLQSKNDLTYFISVKFRQSIFSFKNNSLNE